MANTGKEDYADIMMTAYNQLVLVQDYLHENIHRLQGIFKLFCGGFIWPIQVVLSMNKYTWTQPSIPDMTMSTSQL